jgi:hypothetical protein
MDIPDGWTLVPLTRYAVRHYPSTPNYPYKAVDTLGDGEIVDGYRTEGHAKAEVARMNWEWQERLGHNPTSPPIESSR